MIEPIAAVDDGAQTTDETETAVADYIEAAAERAEDNETHPAYDPLDIEVGFEDCITESPSWLNEDGEAPRFLGTHWECDLCDQISSLSAEDIRHEDDCPLSEGI